MTLNNKMVLVPFIKHFIKDVIIDQNKIMIEEDLDIF
jgi:ribosomal 30S subunit maturation factor RimM